MVLEAVSPRGAAIVGLLALLPVIWYGLGSSLSASVVSAINVLIIVAALYIAFKPVPDSHGHSANDSM